jgi:hypothetical protein
MKMGSELTDRERQYLEHVQRAHSRGQSLAQYCRDAEIKVQDLYSARQQLMRKGVLPVSEGSPRSDRRRDFLPVRVAAPSSASLGMVCRLRHPSGWLIECASWPDGTWLAGVFEAHDAAS